MFRAQEASTTGQMSVAHARAAPSAALATYGSRLSTTEVRRRLVRTLERNVLSRQTPELRGYFELVADQMASPFLGNGEDDAVSTTSDDELEQVCLLFCHFDADGDGLRDFEDPDSDDDGILDLMECPNSEKCLDTDFDSVPDYLDTDSDGSYLAIALVEPSSINFCAECQS